MGVASNDFETSIRLQALRLFSYLAGGKMSGGATAGCSTVAQVACPRCTRETVGLHSWPPPPLHRARSILNSTAIAAQARWDQAFPLSRAALRRTRRLSSVSVPRGRDPMYVRGDKAAQVSPSAGDGKVSPSTSVPGAGAAQVGCQTQDSGAVFAAS